MIILNTACLAMDTHPPPGEIVQQILVYSNWAFTLIFIMELVIKTLGLGFRIYIKEKFNQFDMLIVIMSILQILLFKGSDTGMFSAFRAFRLFKIFKLFKVGDLSILIDSIAFTLTSISDYVILLVIFIYIFSLLGMSLFVSKLKFDPVTDTVDMENGVSPRTNFDNILWALITIF